jgi:hypothetical protein
MTDTDTADAVHVDHLAEIASALLFYDEETDETHGVVDALYSIARALDRINASLADANAIRLQTAL